MRLVLVQGDVRFVWRETVLAIDWGKVEHLCQSRRSGFASQT
jgi:hypothetical protein